MATYYVDFKNGSDGAAGSSGAPFKTPAKAHTVASAGDTIKLRGNKNDAATYYPDSLRIEKANTTWEADAGHTPTFDGGYHPVYGNWATYAPPNATLTGGRISVRAAGITLRNIRLQYLPSAGIGIQETASNLHITGCVVDTTYGLSLNCNSMSKNNPPSNIEIDNCQFLTSSLAMHAPGMGQAAGNAVMLKYLRNVHFHHNVVAYSMKEGINIDKMCEPVIFEYNIVHTINHSCVYLNRARDVDIRYNIFYHTRREEFLNETSDDTPEPVCIKIGDESKNHTDDNVWGHSNRQRIYGNLVIGGSSGLTIANNDSNYDTQLDRAYIGYNTFVGVSYQRPNGQPARTGKIIELFGNQNSPHGNRAHKNSIFENNIIYAPPGVELGTFTPQGGILFRNNLWYSADGQGVSSAAQGSGDIVANPQMANPLAAFHDVWPNPNGGLVINNYQLGAASPAIGRASDRSAANGITPPPVAVDLTGTARTDLDRPNMRYYDIGALERGDGGGTPTGTVTANFTQSGTGGVKPYTVTFTNTSSDTGSANINSYLWEWGDGTTSDSAAGSVQKTYSAAGSYQPRLTVRDTNLGLAHTKIGTMIVVTAPPVADGVTANFTQSGTGGQAPYTVTFTDTSTAQGAAVIHTRNWNFGDGESAAATGVTIQHTYSAAGSYTPTLTVRDAALDLIDTKIGSIITVTAPPVTDGVVANFTQSGTAGQAPYIVTFTNTSTTQGAAVINEWEMRFGDGNVGYNTPFPITYIYSQAGTFTPRLIVRDTARGLSDARNGAAVTVTAPPTGEEPGVMDVARLQLPTVTGDKTIQLNLGGVAPALALFILNKATAMGVAADGAMLSLGATDGVRQWCSAFNANDNLATSKTEKLYSQAACIVSLHDGAVTGRAVLKSVAENQVTLTISDAFPANYYLTVIAFGGPNFRGAVNTFALGVQTSTTTLNPGWRPELWLFGGNAATAFDAVETQGDFAIGLATETEGGAFTWRDVHNLASPQPKAIIMNHPTVLRNTVNNGRVIFSDYNTNTMQVVDAGIDRSFGYAALDITGTTETTVKHYQSPAGTGYVLYELGFRPSGLLIVATAQPVAEGMTLGTLGGFSLVAVDAYATYTTAITSQTAATSNTKSLIADNLIVLKPDGTTGLAGTVTLTETGFGVDWTTVALDPSFFMVTAISGAAAVTGPIPDFTADDLTPENGRVQFTDLSNPNGADIFGWVWDFGDGATSNEQHPVHTYDVPGVYDVSLSVTNVNATEGRVKRAFINYQLGATWLYGNYEPLPVTNATTTRLHGGDEGDPLYGFIEMELNMDGLEIDAYPEDTTSRSGKPGKLRIVADLANNRLKVIMPDGTVKYIGMTS